MNLRRSPPSSRTLRFAHILSAFVVLALLTSPLAHAATDDAAQRQLREDRERFQREVERQRTEAAIQAERARQSAEQQRTADELARLRAQQDRQSSELRTLTESTRTTAPVVSPSPRIATPPSTAASTNAAIATITPDFSITILPDGNCVVYIKGLPAEVMSPSETEKAFRSLLSTKSKAPKQPTAAP